MTDFVTLLTRTVQNAARNQQLATLAHLYDWGLGQGLIGRSGAAALAQIRAEVLPQTTLKRPTPPGSRAAATFEPAAAAASFAAFYAKRSPPHDLAEAVLLWLLEGDFDDATKPGEGTQQRCRAICRANGVDRPPKPDVASQPAPGNGERVDAAWLLGSLPDMLGRVPQLASHLGRLSRAVEARHPLLLEGPAGVGKSLFVRHLLRHAVQRWQGSSSPALASARFTVWSPTDFLGSPAETRTRLEAVAAEARRRPELVPVLDGLEVFLNRATDLADAFATAFGGLLAVGSRPLLLVGRTGPALQSELLKNVPTVSLTPLGREDTAVAVRRRLDRMLRDENLVLDDPDGFVHQLLDLAVQRYPGRFFPEVGLHLADSACARAVNRTVYLKQEPLGRLTPDDLWQHVAEEQGLFAELLGRNAAEFYAGTRRGLKEDIIGQDHAVDTVVDLLQSQLGRPPRREPRGRFLFVGPPGVGKTAFARALARRLGYGEEAFFTFSMAEYGSDSARTRFLGADPGYVGFKSTRTLFDLVRGARSCVVLLDEVDRADVSLQDILLGILEGEGKDSEGQSVYFSQAVFVLTTNLGQEAVESAYREAMRAGRSRAELAASFGDKQLRALILAGLTDETEDEMRRYLDGRIDRAKEAFRPDGADEAALGAVAAFVELRELRRRLELARRTSPLDRAFLDRLESVIPFFPLREEPLCRDLLELQLRRAGWPDCPLSVKEAIMVELAADTRPDDPAGPSVRAMQRLIEVSRARAAAPATESHR